MKLWSKFLKWWYEHDLKWINRDIRELSLFVNHAENSQYDPNEVAEANIEIRALKRYRTEVEKKIAKLV